MKKLKIKPNKENYHWAYTEDIQRIVKVFSNHGFEISESDAVQSWERHSEMFMAGWLILPENNEEIYYYLKDYFEEYE